MAYNQSQRCELERVGVKSTLKFLNKRKRQSFKCPFDVVTSHFGYEVKSLSANSRDLKIHISDASLKRKLDYARIHGIQPLLVAVICYDSRVELYQSRLTKSCRINQMVKIS
jgi:hypothetical protein